MAGPFRWLVISGAVLIASGIVRLDVAKDLADSLSDAPSPSAVISQSKVVADAVVELPEVVMFRDASGSHQPLALGLAARGQALFMVFSPAFTGEQVVVTLWRHQDGVREVTPWIRLPTVVRGDGTLPIAGVIPGLYDVEIALPEGPCCVISAAKVPGEVRVAISTPAR